MKQAKNEVESREQMLDEGGDYEYAVIQLANGRFFCLHHGSSRHVRACVNFGEKATDSHIRAELASLCKQRGIPMPTHFRIRRVKAQLIPVIN